jgi:hypothetical protein
MKWRDCKCPQDMSCFKLIIMWIWWYLYLPYLVVVLLDILIFSAFVGLIELTIYACLGCGKFGCAYYTYNGSFFKSGVECAKRFWNCNIDYFCCSCMNKVINVE